MTGSVQRTRHHIQRGLARSHCLWASMHERNVVPLVLIEPDRLEPHAGSWSRHRGLEDEIVRILLQIREEKARLAGIEHAEEGGMRLRIKSVNPKPTSKGVAWG